MSIATKDRLQEAFKDQASFSREELFDFFRRTEPELNEGTFGWRVFALKEKNIIQPINRSNYVLSTKPIYKPVLSQDLQKFAKLITTKYKGVQYCVWETSWLNEFTRHQTSKSMILVEIEKSFAASLYFELKTATRAEVFLHPDEQVIALYISESKRPLVVKNLISRSPTAQIVFQKTRCNTPQLEKILVDLFAEEKLFYAMQGSELVNIFENVIDRYPIDFTKLFSYAKRRGKAFEIEEFMTKHLHLLPQDI